MKVCVNFKENLQRGCLMSPQIPLPYGSTKIWQFPKSLSKWLFCLIHHENIHLKIGQRQKFLSLLLILRSEIIGFKMKNYVDNLKFHHQIIRGDFHDKVSQKSLREGKALLLTIIKLLSNYFFAFKLHLRDFTDQF